jgi:hypothetical protein
VVGARPADDRLVRYQLGTVALHMEAGLVEVFHGIIAQHVLGLPRPSYPGSKVLIGRKRDRAAALGPG